jgi:hypothetical protein
MGMAFALPALIHTDGSATPTTPLPSSGTWKSAPDELPLTSPFDESVWGKNAKSVRTVEMTVRPTGDATLTVTRRVLNAKGRSVPGSTTIERAELVLGAVRNTTGVRADLDVTIKHAERRYPDDPSTNWPLEGVQVSVTTFTDDPATLEVRIDFPEGRGSFWETLRRGTSK